MNNIFAAASAIMTPYSSAPLKMSLSCIAVDDDGTVTVPWSVAYGRRREADRVHVRHVAKRR